MALRSMVDAANGERMGPEVTNQVLVGRVVVGEAAIRTVDLAMDVARGAGFFRTLGLERLFRDVQAARYHPLRGAAQRRYTGRLALGIDLDD
jgi:acyl-CoA dehydrogenase